MGYNRTAEIVSELTPATIFRKLYRYVTAFAIVSMQSFNLGHAQVFEKNKIVKSCLKPPYRFLEPGAVLVFFFPSFF